MRAELIAAALRLLRRDGLARVTVRNVAAEAHRTPGFLRHYFASHGDLLRALMEATGRAAQTRIHTHLTDLDRSPNERGRDAMRELLPLDEERRVESHVYLAFVLHAHSHPEFQADVQLTFDSLRSVCRFAVAEHARVDHGWDLMGPLADAALEAKAELVSEALDGLAFRATFDRTLDTAQIDRLFDALVTELLPTPLGEPRS